MNFGGTRCAVGTYAGFHLGALTDTLYIAGNAGIFNSPWTRTIVYDGAVSGINTITNSRAAQERMHNIYGHPADRNTTKNTKGVEAERRPAIKSPRTRIHIILNPSNNDCNTGIRS